MERGISLSIGMLYRRIQFTTVAAYIFLRDIQLSAVRFPTADTVDLAYRIVCSVISITVNH